MAKPTVTLRMSPQELQIVAAALICYIRNVEDQFYLYTDLTPANHEPLKAIRMAKRIMQDIRAERGAT